MPELRPLLVGCSGRCSHNLESIGVPAVTTQPHHPPHTQKAKASKKGERRQLGCHVTVTAQRRTAARPLAYSPSVTVMA